MPHDAVLYYVSKKPPRERISGVPSVSSEDSPADLRTRQSDNVVHALGLVIDNRLALVFPWVVLFFELCRPEAYIRLTELYGIRNGCTYKLRTFKIA